MIYRMSAPLVLASASPRRRELLASLGLEFEIRPAGAEPPPQAGEDPRAFALRAAEAKCREVAQRSPDTWTLGADSVVVVENEILGKPGDEAEALAMLEKLCGGREPLEHTVCTGCCLLRLNAPDGGAEERVKRFTVCTRVVMPPQPETVRRAYVATGEPMDKAGAYAIQGLGSFLAREIKGSYTNVVGLPLAEVVEVLVEWGVVVPEEG